MPNSSKNIEFGLINSSYRFSYDPSLERTQSNINFNTPYTIGKKIYYYHHDQRPQTATINKSYGHLSAAVTPKRFPDDKKKLSFSHKFEGQKQKSAHLTSNQYTRNNAETTQKNQKHYQGFENKVYEHNLGHRKFHSMSYENLVSQPSFMDRLLTQPTYMQSILSQPSFKQKQLLQSKNITKNTQNNDSSSYNCTPNQKTNFKKKPSFAEYEENSENKHQLGFLNLQSTCIIMNIDNEDKKTHQYSLSNSPFKRQNKNTQNCRPWQYNKNNIQISPTKSIPSQNQGENKSNERNNYNIDITTHQNSLRNSIQSTKSYDFLYLSDSIKYDVPANNDFKKSCQLKKNNENDSKRVNKSDKVSSSDKKSNHDYDYEFRKFDNMVEMSLLFRQSHQAKPNLRMTFPRMSEVEQTTFALNKTTTSKEFMPKQLKQIRKEIPKYQFKTSLDLKNQLSPKAHHKFGQVKQCSTNSADSPLIIQKSYNKTIKKTPLMLEQSQQVKNSIKNERNNMNSYSQNLIHTPKLKQPPIYKTQKINETNYNINTLNMPDSKLPNQKNQIKLFEISQSSSSNITKDLHERSIQEHSAKNQTDVQSQFFNYNFGTNNKKYQLPHPSKKSLDEARKITEQNFNMVKKSNNKKSIVIITDNAQKTGNISSISTSSNSNEEETNNGRKRYTNYADYKNNIMQNRRKDQSLQKQKDHISFLETNTSFKGFNTQISKFNNNSEQKVILQKQHRKSLEVVSSNVLTNKMFQIRQFQLGKTIGSGRYGDVLVARHKKTGFLMSIKKVLKSTIQQVGILDQFVNQIKLHSQFNHENIIQMYSFFEDEFHIFILMEFANGGNLLDYSKSQKFKKLSSYQKEKKISSILYQLLNALAYMHRNGIIHRDIKLQNVLISQKDSIKLCDFGYSANIKNGMKRTFCGTLDYIAPEIMENNLSKDSSSGYDYSVDLWAVGILAYQLFVGKAPYTDEFRKLQKLKQYKKKNSSFLTSIKEWSQMYKNVRISYPDQISQLGKSFIKDLLNEDPKKRMNIFQALKHPFIKKYQLNLEIKR